MKVIYKSKTAKHSQMKPKGNWEFQGRKVRVLSKESRSFLSPNTKCSESAEKGRLRVFEQLVNFIDLRDRPEYFFPTDYTDFTDLFASLLNNP